MFSNLFSLKIEIEINLKKGSQRRRFVGKRNKLNGVVWEYQYKGLSAKESTKTPLQKSTNHIFSQVQLGHSAVSSRLSFFSWP